MFGILVGGHGAEHVDFVDQGVVSADPDTDVYGVGRAQRRGRWRSADPESMTEVMW